MSKKASGFVLFSLLMALSLGVAFAEEMAATENVTVNETVNATINATANATLNATANETINATTSETVVVDTNMTTTEAAEV